MQKGVKILDKVDTAFDRLVEPFETFLGAISTISPSLVEGILLLNAFVEFLTRTLFCSYQKGFREYYDKMQAWVSGLVQQVGKAIGFISELKGFLTILNPFKGLMSGLFKGFNAFKSVLGGVSGFAKVLAFIEKLFAFKVCYAVPKGCSKPVDFGFLGTLKIPWICWGDKSCTGLEDIGNFMKKIENIIRSIPLVGELWGLVESFVNGVMQKLFKFFGSLLPTFE